MTGEWGVMQHVRGENPKLMASASTEQEAQHHLAFLLERDQGVRMRAEIEEAGGDPGHFSFLWHQGEDGRALKDASYSVARRLAGAWERVDV